MANQQKYQLGHWLIDPSRCLITGPQGEQKLELRVMQVLLCLLEHAGETVSRDNLIDWVWRGGIVSDNAINRIVALIRSYLGDDSKRQEIIKTIPKLGYVLVAPVVAVSTSPITTPVTDHEIHPITSPSLSISSTADVAVSPTMLTHAGRHGKTYGIAALLLIVTVVALVLSRGQFSNSETVLSTDLKLLQPLTSLDGQEVDPILSPDGNTLAFAYRPLGAQRWQIATQDSHTGEVHLLNSTTANQRYPAWSPDAKQLAYLSFDDENGCQIMRQSIEKPNSSPILVTHCNKSTKSTSLEWSASGQQLYFVDSNGVDVFKKIYSIALNDGHIEPLSQPHAVGRGDYSISLSPNGTQLAVLRSLNWFETQVMLFSIDTGEWQTLFQVGYPLRSVGWGVNNDELFYRGDDGQLYAYTISSGHARRLTGILQDINSPKSNRLGQLTAVVGEVVEEEVWRWDSPFDTVADWPPQALITSSRRDDMAAISPDGRQQVFVSNRSGLPQIWLRNNLGAEIKLTQFKTFSHIDELSFSDNGEYIAGTINRNAFVMTMSDRAPRYIPNLVDVRNISWGMDNQQLVVTRLKSGTWYIELINIHSGDPISILSVGGFSGRFDKETGDFYFSKMYQDGMWKLSHGQEVLFTSDFTPHFSTAWSINQGNIYFIAAETPTTFLYQLNLTSKMIAKREIPMANISLRGLSTSSSNQMLFSVLADSNTDVVLITM